MLKCEERIFMQTVYIYFLNKPEHILYLKLNFDGLFIFLCKSMQRNMRYI